MPPRTSRACFIAARSNHRLLVEQNRWRSRSASDSRSSLSVCADSRRTIRPSLLRRAKWPHLRSDGVRRTASIANAQAKAEETRLSGEAEKSRRAALAEAEAIEGERRGEAERSRRVAEAQATRAEGEATAAATLAVGQAEAEAMDKRAEAFAHYRDAGVAAVMCQEKHMGSRAVALVRREDAGGDPSRPLARRGALHTRTGRSFLDPALTSAFLARLAGAAERAGLFDELDSDWLLLDAELLPWSAKAGDLVRAQYAAVGAAARAALPQARARFLDQTITAPGQLIVKHGLTGHATQREYVWSTVTGWPDPGRIHGVSMSDAETDPTVRAGRPTSVDAATVVDWGIWVDGRGIIEGGWTNQLLS